MLNRALVSDGFEEAVKILAKEIPIQTHKIKSGTACFDWQIPQKWEIRNAWVKDESGKKIIDWKNHPLHVVIGSSAIDQWIIKDELLKKLHYSKEYPDFIPYKYCYYQSDWGFCCSKKIIDQMQGDKFHVYIDADLKDGDMIVAEHIIKGKSPKSIVLMAHLDHPGQVQDGISGCALLLQLAQKLENYKPYYTLRFLFLPERIGSIAYLAQNPKIRKNILGGVFTEMISVPKHHLVLQHSKYPKNLVDRVSVYVLSQKVKKYQEADCFNHILNDDAFFNAPGIDIPCISITRSNALTETNTYHHPYYHTSGDNLNFWDQQEAEETLSIINDIIKIINDDRLIIRNYEGVPFLSKYNLWVNDHKAILMREKILNHLDNKQTIFTLAENLKIPFEFVMTFIKELEKNHLVQLKPTNSQWFSKL